MQPLLSTDGWLLFATRSLRMFAYGGVSVMLVLHLNAIGLEKVEIGLLLLLTLLGDTVISLWLTTQADRLGRRRMLVIGGVLMALAGLLFAVTDNFWLLLLAATIGVISPSGKEVGPFLSLEQAALAHILTHEQRTAVFAWYNLAGAIAAALGALGSGLVIQVLQNSGLTGAEVFRPLFIVYGLIGFVLAGGFLRVSSNVEVRGRFDNSLQHSRNDDQPSRSRLGLHRSLQVVLKLSGLFALDAFAGGFILESLVAYWFYLRFRVDPVVLGGIFFAANLLAGISALAAARVAKRFGLLNTMVFTHLPSNVLLLLVPLMPNVELAIAVLLMRYSISQMDVPTRQSYTMAVVQPDERAAASGVTGVARSLGAALSPALATMLIGNPVLMSVPFFLAGGLKIIYDLLLLRSFAAIKLPEETKDTPR
jgi:MFS family permease